MLTRIYILFFNQMNGSMVSGIQLKVSLARRQPVIDPINDASSSATWSTIGKENLHYPLIVMYLNIRIVAPLLSEIKS